MHAISPFSLADKLQPSGLLGAGLRDLIQHPKAEAVRDMAAAAGSFAQAIDKLGAAGEGTEAQQAGRPFPQAQDAADFVAFVAARAADLQELLANAAPALPGPPASQAPENRPGAELIRATYQTLSRLQ